MVFSILKYCIFLVCFILSVYACSSIQFEKICKVQKSGKVITLLFLISFVLFVPNSFCNMLIEENLSQSFQYYITAEENNKQFFVNRSGKKL